MNSLVDALIGSFEYRTFGVREPEPSPGMLANVPLSESGYDMSQLQNTVQVSAPTYMGDRRVGPYTPVTSQAMAPKLYDGGSAI